MNAGQRLMIAAVATGAMSIVGVACMTRGELCQVTPDEKTTIENTVAYGVNKSEYWCENEALKHSSEWRQIRERWVSLSTDREVVTKICESTEDADLRADCDALRSLRELEKNIRTITHPKDAGKE